MARKLPLEGLGRPYWFRQAQALLPLGPYFHWRVWAGPTSIGEFGQALLPLEGLGRPYFHWRVWAGPTSIGGFGQALLPLEGLSRPYFHWRVWAGPTSIGGFGQALLPLEGLDKPYFHWRVWAGSLLSLDLQSFHSSFFSTHPHSASTSVTAEGCFCLWYPSSAKTSIYTSLLRCKQRGGWVSC